MSLLDEVNDRLRIMSHLHNDLQGRLHPTLAPKVFGTLSQEIEWLRSLRDHLANETHDHCDSCGCELDTKDIEGGRCLTCGSMILPRGDG